MAELPPIRELVPHRPPMLWLRRVVAHAGDTTECEAHVDDLTLLHDQRGAAPGYAMVELAAQCVSAHARLAAESAGPPRVGLLLGARRFTLYERALAPGQRLLVRATRLWGGGSGPASFEAEVRDANSGALLAAGRISCFAPTAEPDARSA